MPGPSPRVRISEEQHHVLDGLMLGDGYLEKRSRRRNVRLKYVCKDLSTVALVAANFKQLRMRPPYPVKMRRDGTWRDRAAQQYCTYSPANPEFTDARERWYPLGEKAIPGDLTLNRTSILFWYLGDGSITKDRINFSTHGFTWGDVSTLLVPKLHALGFSSATVYADDGAPRVYLSPYDSTNLLGYIGPCPCMGMAYKWLTKSETQHHAAVKRRVASEALVEVWRLRELGWGPTKISKETGVNRNTLASIFSKASSCMHPSRRHRNYGVEELVPNA